MCEAWLLALREKHGLKVFENRVLRKILGPKRVEVTGHRHRAAFNDLYCSPNVIQVIKSRRMRWAGYEAV